jgi:hypothetical protein
MINALFISEKELKARSVINENVDLKLLMPTILDCQDMHIQPLLGTSLYKEIAEEIEDGAVSNDNKILLEDYIQPALIKWVMAEIPVDLTYKFMNKTVGKKEGENVRAADLSEIHSLMDMNRKKAEWFSERLTGFLKENASATKYAKYLERSCRADHINPKDDNFSLPFYL